MARCGTRFPSRDRLIDLLRDDYSGSGSSICKRFDAAASAAASAAALSYTTIEVVLGRRLVTRKRRRAQRRTIAAGSSDGRMASDGTSSAAVRRCPRSRRPFLAGAGRSVGPAPSGGAARSCSRSAGRSQQLLGEQRVGTDAERDAQLLAVEVGERARLRQHEVGDAALARDDLLDALVDRARDRSAGGR